MGTVQFNVGIALVSFSMGAVSSYLLLDRIIAKEYADLSKAEIENAKKFYSKMYKKDDLSPVEMEKTVVRKEVEENSDILKGEVKKYNYASDFFDVEPKEEEGYLEEIEGRNVEQKVSQETSNVFDDHAEELDPNSEEAIAMNRDPEKPHVIHHDEFYDGEYDYSQVTLTYFEGDDVLVDDKESPINDTNRMVGDENLVKFGLGSKDPRVVYVRNNHLEVDFEILLHDGKFTEEVLGFIEHSEDYHRKPRKFRGDDE